MEREIYRRGLSAVHYFTASLLAVTFTLGGVLLLLLEKTVLSRVVRVGKEVGDIRAKEDIAARMTEDGKDEIACLSREINGMLEALARSQKRLERARFEEEISRTRNEFLARMSHELRTPMKSSWA